MGKLVKCLSCGWKSKAGKTWMDKDGNYVCGSCGSHDTVWRKVS